jgi:hypothetical protein
MQCSEAQPERRKWPRHRVLKEGRIIVGGRTSIDCVVRDMSEGGVKIRLKSPLELLPQAFDLLVVKENLLFPCTLAWRNADTAGVAFTGQAKSFVRKLAD